MGEQELNGLDGNNLLAFLAALGTLKCLSNKIPDVRMSWSLNDSWVPVLHLSKEQTKEALLHHLCGYLDDQAVRDAQFSLGLDPAPNNLDLRISDFRNQLSKAAQSASARSRVQADFLVGLGTDAVTPDDAHLPQPVDRWPLPTATLSNLKGLSQHRVLAVQAISARDSQRSINSRKSDCTYLPINSYYRE